MKIKSLQDTIILITTTWHIFGLPNFYIDKKCLIMIVATSKIVYIIFPIFIVKNLIYLYFLRGEINLENLIVLAKIFVACFQQSLIIIICHKKKHDIVLLCNTLFRIEKTLFQITFKHLQYKEIFKKCCILIGLKCLFILLVSIHDFVTIEDAIVCFKVITYYSSWLYDTLVDIIMLWFLIIASDIYKTLYKVLKSNSISFANLQDIIKLQQNLKKWAKKLNKTFNITLLVKLFTDFIFAFTGFFYYFYDTNYLKNNSSPIFIFQIIELMWVPLVLFTDYYIIKLFDNVIKNVSTIVK